MERYVTHEGTKATGRWRPICQTSSKWITAHFAATPAEVTCAKCQAKAARRAVYQAEKAARQAAPEAK